MANNFDRVHFGINLTPQGTTPTSLVNGDIYYDTSTNRIKQFINGGSEVVVAASSTDTLTNKTISGASNTLSNIADGSLTTSYLKADGTRALTGNWAAGAFSGTFNSVAIGAVAGQVSGVTSLLIKDSGSANSVTIQSPMLGAGYTIKLPNAQATGVLANDGSGNLSWSSAGTGTLTGPVSSTNNAIVVWNGTSGIVTKDSNLIVGSNSLSALNTVSAASGSGLTFQTNGTTTAGSISSAQAWTIGTSGSNASHTINGAQLTLSAGTASAATFQALGNGGQAALDYTGNVSSANAPQTSWTSRFNDGATTRVITQIGSNNTNATAASSGGMLHFYTSNTGGTLTEAFNIDQTQVSNFLGNININGHSIVNTGTLTLPTSSDTLVGRATADTLTNKTISGSSNTLSNIADGSLSTSYLKADGTRALTGDWATGSFRISAGGGAVATTAVFIVNPSAAQNPLTTTTQRGIRSTLVGTSAATVQTNGVSSSPTTAAATALRTYFEADTSAIGAGSATRDVNYWMNGITAGGTNNAGIADNQTFTGNWGINLSSTNKNLLTGPTALGGTTTNDNAAAGQYGEYVESVISSTTSVPGTTGQYGNLTSISLTAGDWDIDGIMSLDNANSAAITAFAGAISVNSGNTTTDQIDGSNQADSATPGAGAVRSITIPSYRLSLSTTTTVFLKMNVAFTVATPQYRCRISARRPR